MWIESGIMINFGEVQRRSGDFGLAEDSGPSLERSADAVVDQMQQNQNQNRTAKLSVAGLVAGVNHASSA
ncbi:unnamed protein product [[Candida] boidinii]|uniref:Unnamed protein product n=1 Tax=Candida boidinii TaxID=5477 RepID=A0ACB5TPA3_CANBO|nr:unnamed protein product [[Candida] boidinii]GMF30202.1 unnamed protein product [[Candida] boidinii]